MSNLEQLTKEIREEDRQAAAFAYGATHFLAGCAGFVIGAVIQRVFG